MGQLKKKPNLFSLEVLGIPLSKWFKAGATIGPFLIAAVMFWGEFQSMKTSLEALKTRMENIEANTNTILQNIIGGNPDR